MREIYRRNLHEAEAATAAGFVATGLRHMKAGDAKQVLALVDAEEAHVFVSIEAHAALAKALVIQRGGDLRDGVELFHLKAAGEA